MKKILVYVQHLLGTGHLYRTALITRGLASNGFNVTVVSGGVAQPLVDFGNVSLIQLPAIKSDSRFTGLLDESGGCVTEDFKQTRKNALLRIFTDVAPDLVLIETYPFGRRQMSFELLPLLQAIKAKQTTCPNPGIRAACSIRDVIQPKSSSRRVQEIVDLVDQHFDYILIHGDKDFIKFDRTFPQLEVFRNKLIYTGYVTRPLANLVNTHRSQNSIVVSAGGGAVGNKLYQTAIKASRLNAGRSYDWLVLVGNSLSDHEFLKIQALQSGNLRIERNRSDFLQLLLRCSVSVSQGGYNTMMDILITGTPAVVVPFEGQAECEQLIRAQAFEQKHRLILLREKYLAEVRLLAAITDCQGRGNPMPMAIKINGAEQMTKIAKDILR